MVNYQKDFDLWLNLSPVFIAQTSGLHHSLACCLVALETEFQFCDTFRHKMTMKILEHVIGELSDSETNNQITLLSCAFLRTNNRTALLSCAFLRTNYRTNHQVLVITSLWVIGSFKDFCRKFSYMSTVSRKVLFENSSRICFINQTEYKRITNCMIIINCTCVQNVFMYCAGVILIEIIVIAIG